MIGAAKDRARELGIPCVLMTFDPHPLAVVAPDHMPPMLGSVAVRADLAEDLGGDYGITLVIDHGAGVRTIFYGLSDIDIKAGQQVKQGQTLATCGKTTVVEMRIGTVPIDPIAVWRGQCNGLKYY